MANYGADGYDALDTEIDRLRKRIAELENALTEADNFLGACFDYAQEYAAECEIEAAAKDQRIAELESLVASRTGEARDHADRANELQRQVDWLKRSLAVIESCGC